MFKVGATLRGTDVCFIPSDQTRELYRERHLWHSRDSSLLSGVPKPCEGGIPGQRQHLVAKLQQLAFTAQFLHVASKKHGQNLHADAYEGSFEVKHSHAEVGCVSRATRTFAIRALRISRRRPGVALAKPQDWRRVMTRASHASCRHTDMSYLRLIRPTRCAFDLKKGRIRSCCGEV